MPAELLIDIHFPNKIEYVKTGASATYVDGTTYDGAIENVSPIHFDFSQRFRGSTREIVLSDPRINGVQKYKQYGNEYLENCLVVFRAEDLSVVDIQKITSWGTGDDTFHLECSNNHGKFTEDCTVKIDESTFPNAPQDNIGKTIPYFEGEFKKVKAYRFDQNKYALYCMPNSTNITLTKVLTPELTDVTSSCTKNDATSLTYIEYSATEEEYLICEVEAATYNQNAYERLNTFFDNFASEYRIAYDADTKKFFDKKDFKPNFGLLNNESLSDVVAAFCESFSVGYYMSVNETTGNWEIHIVYSDLDTINTADIYFIECEVSISQSFMFLPQLAQNYVYAKYAIDDDESKELIYVDRDSVAATGEFQQNAKIDFGFVRDSYQAEICAKETVLQKYEPTAGNRIQTHTLTPAILALRPYSTVILKHPDQSKDEKLYRITSISFDFLRDMADIELEDIDYFQELQTNCKLLLKSNEPAGSRRFLNYAPSWNTKVNAFSQIAYNNTKVKFNESAIEFDGIDQYLVLNYSDYFEFAGAEDFVCYAWVNFDNVTTKQNILTLYKDDNNYYRLLLNASGQLKAALMKNSILEFETLSNTTLTADTWYFVTFARISGKIAIYVNGIQCAFQDYPTYTKLYSGNLYIGQRGDNQNFLDASVDEIVICKKNLGGLAPKSDLSDTHPVPDSSTTVKGL